MFKGGPLQWFCYYSAALIEVHKAILWHTTGWLIQAKYVQTWSIHSRKTSAIFSPSCSYRSYAVVPDLGKLSCPHGYHPTVTPCSLLFLMIPSYCGSFDIQNGGGKSCQLSCRFGFSACGLQFYSTRSATTSRWSWFISLESSWLFASEMGEEDKHSKLQFREHHGRNQCWDQQNRFCSLCIFGVGFHSWQTWICLSNFEHLSSSIQCWTNIAMEKHQF